MASWERFLGAMSWLHFQGASASISRMNRHYFSHDRAAIGVRIVRRSPSFHRRGDSPTFALRSRFDRTAIVEFFHAVSAPSDRDPSDCDPHNHCAPRDPLPSARWRSDAPGDST